MAEGGKQDAGAPIRLSHIYPSRSHDAVNDPLFTFIAVGLPLSVIVYFFRLVAGWSPGSIKGIPIWLTLTVNPFPNVAHRFPHIPLRFHGSCYPHTVNRKSTSSNVLQIIDR